MKLYYGSTPIKSLNIHHFEENTNDCTAIPSDLQAGVTCVSKGKRITGTGKCFEFANYGNSMTNSQEYIPSTINVVEISSLEYPIKSAMSINNMKDIDFTTEQTIGIVTIDGAEYPITVKVEGVFLTFICEKTIALESFYGKDAHI